MRALFQIPRSAKDWFLPRAAAIDQATWVRPGLYHFRRESRGVQTRYHLRVDEDGPAILIAGAAEALLLSPEGAAVAKALLEGQAPEHVEQKLGGSHASQVVDDVRHALEDLGHWDVRYPIFNLVDPALYERPWRMSAPFQADLVVDNERTSRQILDRLWDARIPHVRLLMTPRTEKTTIVECVRHAEYLGMISGVRPRCAAWLDPDTLRDLALAGIDYIALTWGVSPQLHARWYGEGDYRHFLEAIPSILAAEVTPVADAPLLKLTWDLFPARLDELIALGITHIEVFAIAEDVSRPAGVTESPGFDAPALRQLAGWIEDLADNRHVQIIWLPPHMHSKHRSIDEIIRLAPRAGGDVTIRVESHGAVIPPRGEWIVAGNLLEDDWQSIWQHPAFLQFRQQVERATHCAECPDLTVCAAFCPADQGGWVW